MTGMSRYYISRALISIAFAALFAFTGTPWWQAVLIGAAAMAFFLYAPHSGRYAVYPELGATALRRDERTQAITDKAARNAFVAGMLALAGVALYYAGSTAVPLVAIHWILILGALVYFLSDLLLRRSS